MNNKLSICFVKYLLLIWVLFTPVSKAATEDEIITKLQKSTRVYVIRSKDSKLFLLLDKAAIGLDEKRAVDSVKSYLENGTDALCLEGNFGKKNIFAVYPVVRKNIYFVSSVEGKKTTMKPVSEILTRPNFKINLDILNNYLKD